MKKFTRVLTLLMAALMLALVFPMAVSAKPSAEEMQENVVFLETTICYNSSNYDGFSIYSTFSGTGSAIGVPGKPVQHIVTAAHVVETVSGIYTAILSLDGEVIAIYAEEDGTKYPEYREGEYSGIDVIAITDYYNTVTVDKRAYFSSATNDYTTITLVDINHDVDLALCKLSCDPTDKIKAFPLQFKNNVNKGDSIIAYGFPGITEFGNAEMRLDPSDCTLRDGIISRITRTNGLNNANITYDAYLVTAELNHGMSGGPVFHEKTGTIIGITSFGKSEDGESARYATCIDYLKGMLDKEGIEYKVYGEGISILLLAIIGVVVILMGGIVVLVILLIKKNNKPAAAPVVADAPIVSRPPVAAPEAKYYLIGVSGVNAGRKFGISESPAVLGRDGARCNVTFPVDQPGVSGVHCEVKRKNGSLYLTDLGSSYGTFLGDGTKLTANTPVILSNGSKFWVGSQENLFEVRY